MAVYLKLLLVFIIFSFGNSLKIGSFNIQVFGESKSKKVDVMEIIGKIIVRYDIILIMEIKDSKKIAVPKLLEAVKAHSGEDVYSMIISDRLGRTNSKEQYAFLYRNDAGLEVVDSFVYDDGNEAEGNDKFEREPFIVRFKSSKTDVEEFILIGIHVDPDVAVAEINSLEVVLDDTSRRTGVDNIIILGDLNADCRYVSKTKMKTINLRHRSDLDWPIDDDTDTTTSNTQCAYDRFIIGGTQLRKSIIPGSAKVFDYQQEYNLNIDLTKKVSDHYPIELEIKDNPDSTDGPGIGKDFSDGRKNYSHDMITIFFVTLACVKLLVYI